MTEDELREAAIEYLQQSISSPKKSYEFTAKELSIILKRTVQNVYPYMEKLVAERIWDTRIALDQRTGRQTRVWWLVEG